VYYWIIIARLLLSWFPNPPEGLRPVYRFLYDVTEPVLRLARPLIPPVRMGGMAMDFSPLLVFVVLYVLRVIVC
jgi:YggT family protein